ncbi:hypothetical protein MYOV056v2_p0134 [Vibrio phage 184E37.3a]|nr:hypothetical protein MYOV056v2_p0134 [Vibrio phage 184E37.3a]QZI89920.1 hypothetical protein MYOV057v1_p0005 [Vibrio phage 184E37.1]
MIYIVKLSNENETLLKLGFTSKNTTYNRFQAYKSKFDKVELLHTFLEEDKYNVTFFITTPPILDLYVSSYDLITPTQHKHDFHIVSLSNVFVVVVFVQ